MEPSRHDPPPPDRPGLTWLSQVRLPESGACGQPERKDQGDEGPAELDLHGRLWRVAIDGQGLIAALHPIAPGSRAAGIDWRGDWLSPAGVDLQINGGLGLAFPELTAADLPRLQDLLELLWRDGVEAICPTLVTCAVEPLREALAVLRQARAAHRPGRCRLLGAHLEGPFLAPARRGAHPLQHLCPPSPAALRERIGGFFGPDAGAPTAGWSEDTVGGRKDDSPGGAEPNWSAGAAAADIALVTLAPELEGASAVIEALRRQGVVVSLGHSEATESEATAAYDAGVAMVTHAYNAVPAMHHRAPGPVAAAALRGDVALGLIADGVHVAPTMAVLVQRLAPQQVVLVSDALAPYGLADGLHRWDERTLVVENGSCRLEDGTLAGVTLPLLEGALRLARWSGRPERAIAAATVLPRRVLGEKRPLSELLLGRPLAECLRWSQGADGLRWQRAA
ncbi:MAG: N-acetylglucosamine-6-phosphate deacetylase [Cyanobacteria bacterium]|nr:N-acetylglucosamine-6-phosphate deacetylase [Cyanobacteriota bacterium]